MFWASSDTSNYLETDTALIETINNAKYVESRKYSNASSTVILLIYKN